MPIPEHPKIYHIVHVNCLPSIINDGCLWCDAEIARRNPERITIGMGSIKHRRLHMLKLVSHPDLHVGDCVPFYFCPRSVMLFLIYCANHPELEYRGGQDPIIHLESDMHDSIEWANQHDKRWAFTLSNAGARYFEDRCSIEQLGELNWSAVNSNQWSGLGISPSIKEGKQAEFLMEYCFPWHLIECIGVKSTKTFYQVKNMLSVSDHHPKLENKPEWYY